MSIRLLAGDCRDILQGLPAESVQCVVTSPPYYALRSYLHAEHPDKHREIGSEATPAEYLATMVQVFREIRRVLRADGTCWVNMGDSYAGNTESNGRSHSVIGAAGNRAGAGERKQGIRGGAKPKDLLMMPARLAIALQQDGWWVRSDIIWHKPNPMPESVTDRPTSAHEHVFLLTKSARYYYDADAVREARSILIVEQRKRLKHMVDDGDGRTTTWSLAGRWTTSRVATIQLAAASAMSGRSPRRHSLEVTLLPCQRQSLSAASRLARRSAGVAASAASRGCAQLNVAISCLRARTTICAHLASWSRRRMRWRTRAVTGHAMGIVPAWHMRPPPPARRAGCDHDAPVMPCTVLDPFAGAGTTLLVADRLQRDAIGIELNVAYT